ncbi:hypothetical protein KBY58_08160 [Cyanobium sp. HWJ4-Hawea]|uniref:hypothetical protein n=1 Tax=Cyanobium sp. HWJ4-Hawea TaxID=2823713 RepID=UPI0020CB9028|nr:hypothetical protein [Cyanobium sp. HWJ4-Hawea]MCP9809405.1 hypothetical protein [Cyanobium sp. HWJ4-Hawea]
MRGFLTAGFLALAAAIVSPLGIASAKAEPAPVAPNTLAALLTALNAKPGGLYDGLRYFQVMATNGPITITVNCDKQTWRVLVIEDGSGRPGYLNDPFLPAGNIRSSRICTEPVRALK